MARKRESGITILGLGPGQRRYLTREAEAVLRRFRDIYLRTIKHPIASELPKHLAIQSFDYVYDEAESFEQVYQTIAALVIDLAQRPQGVLYAVPGHPLVAEQSVQLILAEATAHDIPVRIVAGLSFLEPVFTALGLDPFQQGLQLLDATTLASILQRNEPGQSAADNLFNSEDILPNSALLRRILSPQTPVLLSQLYDRRVASSIKLGLMDLYPDEHPVTLVQAAGVEDSERVITIPLFQLDHRDVDHLTSVYLPPLPARQDLASFETLRTIIAHLRGPNGCPWDREQTTESLKPYLVEESYEVLEAIDTASPDKLAEELGDLLLQIVLHAQLAFEQDDFSMDDVIEGLSSKMIRRHPHVFGHVSVSGSTEVLRNWEQIKRAEKGEDRSTISAVPKHLPALAYAQAVQRRAARSGFDWPEPQGVLDKVKEEVGEFVASQNKDEQKAELGDVLFSLVNLARWYGIDAEESLRQANRRFLQRFRRMEELAAAQNQDFATLGPDKQNSLWDQAKREQR